VKKIVFLASFILIAFSISAAGAAELSGQVNALGLREPNDILVYLAKTPGFTEAPTKQYVMDQRDLTFLPHVLVIPRGATVAFPNNDKVDHNVFSLSRTKKFNFGKYAPGVSHNVRFDKAGIVKLRCDIHAEMRAYILVMKSPYYALTDENGRFKIDISGLPAGRYELKTWHSKLRNSTTPVELNGGSSKVVNLKLYRGIPGVLYK
jgi:plastocyanin